MLERFIQTLKDEWLRKIVIPFRQDRMRQDIHCYLDWYNEFRPHMSLRGKTPNEVYFNRIPANERLRFEPRTKFPRDSLCAAPYTAIRGRRGQKLELFVRYFADHKHLPIVELKKIA